jgi:hypothetical protein
MFVNKLKMNSVAEAVKKITEKESVTEAEKVPTATGMKVYGSSYGDSAKARRDQVKKDIDTIKGPKTKDLIQKDKEDYEKTKGRYDEAAKPDFLDMDKDGDKKEPMKKAVADKKKSGGMNETHEFGSKLIEALKGNQHKIDKNKNNKIDSQDFKILRGEKSVAEASCEDEAKQEVKKHEKKLHGKDGEVSQHVDKMHKEEIEQIEEKNVPTSPEKWARAKAAAKSKFAVYPSAYANGWASKKYKAMGGGWKSVSEEVEEVEQIEEKEMTDAEMAKREKIVMSMKKGFSGFRQRYGKDAKSVMYATATKQAMKEDAVEEEIDPSVRTKDTLKGQEPTSQKDDVGPGSDAKSTKVKFRGGPMKEEVKKSDIPAFIRKARGDKPLTVADVKAGRKDSISSKENLAKARGVQEGKGPESDTVPFVTNAEQPPFDGPYKKVRSTVTDKSGAKHTPMSRARDLARSAMKRIKTEMLGKAPGNNG